VVNQFLNHLPPNRRRVFVGNIIDAIDQGYFSVVSMFNEDHLPCKFLAKKCEILFEFCFEVIFSQRKEKKRKEKKRKEKKRKEKKRKEKKRKTRKHEYMKRITFEENFSGNPCNNGSGGQWEFSSRLRESSFGMSIMPFARFSAWRARVFEMLSDCLVLKWYSKREETSFPSITRKKKNSEECPHDTMEAIGK